MLRASYYYNFTVLVYYIYSHYNKYSYGGFRYKSSLYNHRMHLLSLISCYCTLIYNNDVVLLCFICNHHKTLLISQIIITKICLSHKFQINYFLLFLKAIFPLQTLNPLPFQKLRLSRRRKKRRPHGAKIERRGYIVVRPIMQSITTTET